ncbi:hypothetical protein Taro_029313 [Colocasia esculenta]|uniref:Uncharacterized protein n=1 Tax=Colocasia esculenta TaxID=4460 RepID=A0A843VDI1_COLES|nr:hypothetical protein [Colocasia esculenta]
MMKGLVEPWKLNVGYRQAWLQYIISSLLRGQKVWDTSSKFSRGVPALKMVPGVPVKMKVQGEHVSVQSTKHGKIRQHKVYRPSTKDKYKEQAPATLSDRAELREFAGQCKEKTRLMPLPLCKLNAAPSPSSCKALLR